MVLRFSRILSRPWTDRGVIQTVLNAIGRQTRAKCLDARLQDKDSLPQRRFRIMSINSGGIIGLMLFPCSSHRQVNLWGGWLQLLFIWCMPVYRQSLYCSNDSCVRLRNCETAKLRNCELRTANCETTKLRNCSGHASCLLLNRSHRLTYWLKSTKFKFVRRKAPNRIFNEVLETLD